MGVCFCRFSNAYATGGSEEKPKTEAREASGKTELASSGTNDQQLLAAAVAAAATASQKCRVTFARVLWRVAQNANQSPIDRVAIEL